MARRLPLFLLLCLPVLTTGCIGLNFERGIDGRPDAVARAETLTPQADTLRYTLEHAGHPDLILRAGDRDRLYYLAWDSDYFKIVVSLAFPIAGRSFSWDLFIWSSGKEFLHLARLDFTGDGILDEKHIARIRLDRTGKSAGMKNTYVSLLLEDKERALSVSERKDDNDEKDEAPPQEEPGEN